jgi:hypothetical protein
VALGSVFLVPFCTQNTLRISSAWPQVIQRSYKASVEEVATGFTTVWDSRRARVKEVGLQAVIVAHAEESKGTMTEPKIGRPLEVTGPSKRPRIQRQPIDTTYMRPAVFQLLRPSVCSREFRSSAADPGPLGRLRAQSGASRRHLRCCAEQSRPEHRKLPSCLAVQPLRALDNPHRVSPVVSSNAEFHAGLLGCVQQTSR